MEGDNFVRWQKKWWTHLSTESVLTSYITIFSICNLLKSKSILPSSSDFDLFHRFRVLTLICFAYIFYNRLVFESAIYIYIASLPCNWKSLCYVYRFGRAANHQSNTDIVEGPKYRYVQSCRYSSYTSAQLLLRRLHLTLTNSPETL